MTSPKISDTAVSKATGWSWEEWFALLDEKGAKELEHKEIVKLLRDAGLKSGWWCQMITVEYERSRQGRSVGESASVGYEIGVRRTFEVAPRRAWDVLMRTRGLKIWLGDVRGWKLEKGQAYETADGITGEVRSVRPGEKVRLAWRPMGWEHESIVQVTVIPVARKATIAFHQEHLPSEKERERMRKHWSAALDALQELL
jgi:uncharacterized protein YndB with AHSA1/START domain